ncbi:hypothetical protein BJX76DRAFT_363289 [Aspergillus varians]
MSSPARTLNDYVPPTELDNAEIRSAMNPSTHGYHHGPIYRNGMLDPAAATPVGENGVVLKQKVSKVHGGICWLTVSGAKMCGQTFAESPTLYRHMRQAHAEHMVNLSVGGRGNIKGLEIADGENALKRFILERRWFSASFVREPGIGPVGGIIHRFCDAMEQHARFDREFAETWGTRFHRPSVPRPANAPAGNRFGGSPTPATPPSAPNRQDRRLRQIVTGGVSSFQARRICGKQL